MSCYPHVTLSPFATLVKSVGGNNGSHMERDVAVLHTRDIPVPLHRRPEGRWCNRLKRDPARGCNWRINKSLGNLPVPLGAVTILKLDPFSIC